MDSFKNIPVLILAGGFGTRLSEETQIKPKPMIEIGGIPILLHIMRYYYAAGFNDFVICAGYKSEEIKDFFANYALRMNNVEIDHRESCRNAPTTLGLNAEQESWRIRILDTGKNTMTGGRVARALDEIPDDFDHFALTYGDGLSDCNLKKEFQFHTEHGRIGTMLGVPPLARFGALDVGNDGMVKNFIEKPVEASGLINGGFFFFKRNFREYLSSGESCILEREPLEKLTKDQELFTFQHQGFWQCMDTLRDKQSLQNLWDSGKAPWLF